MADGDFTPQLLSGSTNGRPISVAAESSPGTLIHTPSTSDPSLEYVTLYVINPGSTLRTITIEFGGTSTSDQITDQIPSESVKLIADRYPIRGAGNVIRAFASATNTLLIVGRVTKAEVPS